jgi:hypothetical protein
VSITRDLADVAHEIAGGAPASSTRRRAFACAAIALREARTVTGARKILNAECPEFIRAQALEALDQLATEEPA